MKTYFLLLLLALSVASYALPTTLTIRAKAKDAKFIGSSIGGAQVIVRNKLTGEILAQGKTTGSTGNTDLIMRVPVERYKPLADDQTAAFVAVLDIASPTFVTIEVKATVSVQQATITATTELWVIPGKHVVGDGIVVEIPGFAVEILQPVTHQTVSLVSPVILRANVVMMCGCTITDLGLWDANMMEVKGLVSRDGVSVGEFELKLVAQNTFEGTPNIKAKGNYEILVYAFDARTGNSGVDQVNFILTD